MALFKVGIPNERQKLFLSATQKYIGFGGARGGGKSWAVRTKAILLSLNYAGIKILIVRKTFSELRNNHIDPLTKITTDIANYNDSKKQLTFKNGSVIKFGYCSCNNDLTQYQGSEWDIIFLDEATQLKEEWFDELKVTVRGVNDFPKRIYLTCNPGGVGHAWVKRLFIDKKYKDGEESTEYTFIRSKVTDNIALMKSNPGYIKQLQALPPKLREAWLEGSWDVYEGQFFEEFIDSPEHYTDRRFTHVIEPFEIPDGWKIYRSFDWGYAKPFSCAWWAVDFDGVVYRILELYGCTKTANEGVKWTPQKVFGEIHRIETEHRWLKGKHIRGVADPAIWDAQTGESIADVASANRVYFDKGDHKRIPGWMQMHYRMAFDENGYPMMYVFKNCQAFIRTIPLLCYDDHNVEDIDTSMEDHIADECRYFLMTRPITPKEAKKRDEYLDTPMAQFLDIPKENIVARPNYKPTTIIRR